MISESKKFIFIHIDKTAGNSISSMLAPYCSDNYVFSQVKYGHIVENRPDEDITTWNDQLKTVKHSDLQAYYDALGDKIWGYYKFCCIRNPWDRAVSAGVFSANGCNPGMLKSNYAYLKRQIDYIKINGEISIDDFIRFENIQEDFDRICNKLEIPQTTLPHKNRSNHKPYWHYYDDQVRQLVFERFKEDIEHFGYKFH